MPKIKSKEEIFEKITNEDNLYKAYYQTQSGKKKYKKEAVIFRSDETYNMLNLRQSLIDETYEFDGYNEFIVKEPKERIVNAPHYKDKIVQIAIGNVLKEIYFPCFINDSYSCIDKKGTHKCVKRIQYFLRQAQWEYGEDATIVKIDMKKFFYTIDRDILKKLLAMKIKCEKTLRLLYKIIDSADAIDELGLPLGNTLSQMFSNVCMNVVDQFAKRKLSIKFYARYADDVFIIVENKEKAKEILDILRLCANEKLNLNINEDKSKIFPVSKGINIIGYKIYTTHMLLRNDSKKRIKRKLKAIPRLIRENRLTVGKAEQMLDSWQGHADYSCDYNFIQALIKKYDFLYLNGKSKLKINRKKVLEYGI